MMLRALRCRLSPDGGLDIAPWTGAPADLVSSGAAGAYLVSDDTFEPLCRQTGLIHDCGRKHPSRSLASLLVRRPRVPAVRAAFRSTRQLARSLRTLLERAARDREWKAYVIAVPADVLDDAAVQAGAGRPTDDARDGGVELDLFDEEVPVELEDRLVGTSPAMRQVRQRIVRAAAHDEPVLILGETGTGKELVARSIHLLSPSRRHQPFLAVNCGAIPQELFESEVFGYVPGAFTGAQKRGSEGIWRSARGGTVFLDEIGDLAPAHQVKLLRVLEQRSVRPVGATREVAVDARVIAATNRELYGLVRTGEFREDLYYRLVSMFIPLPRLRDRLEDVPVLARHFWREIAPTRALLGSDVLRELRRYRWHGNARELRYVLVNLHTTFQKGDPTVAHLRAVMRMRVASEGSAREDVAEAALRRMDQLRHLRRAVAAIDVCRRIVRAFGDRGTGEGRRNGLQADLAACFTELQLLATRPERFLTLGTLEATHRLCGSIGICLSLLGRNDARANRRVVDLAREARAADAAVRREEERILKSL